MVRLSPADRDGRSAGNVFESIFQRDNRIENYPLWPAILSLYYISPVGDAYCNNT
jgi:hypothetical protein